MERTCYMGWQRWHSRLYPSRSWHLIQRPQRDARLSWPQHCSKGVQPVPKTAYQSSCRDEHSRPWWDGEIRTWVLSNCRGGRCSGRVEVQTVQEGGKCSTIESNTSVWMPAGRCLDPHVTPSHQRAEHGHASRLESSLQFMTLAAAT